MKQRDLAWLAGVVVALALGFGMGRASAPSGAGASPAPTLGEEPASDSLGDLGDLGGRKSEDPTAKDAKDAKDSSGPSGASSDAGTDERSDPSADEEPGSSADATSGSVRVRVVAANLTSGRRQSYDPGHGARILTALKPDVVLIQEFNCGGNRDSDVKRFVRETFGEGFHHVRETGAQIPNGVVSRWPILASGKWEDDACPNREFVWARIDVPGPIDLWAISLHLLTKNPSTRDREARQLVGYLRENVPDADYLVVGGDLNVRHPGEPALKTLSELVSSRHVPVDGRGRAGTNASRKRPYDQVLPDADLEAHHVPVELGGRSFPHGLVFDSRSFRPLPAGVQEADSGAEQMQHMAVIKDFEIPGN